MFPNLVIAVKQWHRMLSNELDSAERKFHGERFLVNWFQKAWTKRPVYPDGRSDNLLG